MGGNSFRTVIRLIAGGYICYLGYQLIKGYLYPTEETGDPVWFMMLFGIAFLVVGAFLIVDAIRKAAVKNEEESDEESDNQDGTDVSEEKKLPDKEDETEAVPDAPEADDYPHTMTIADRIRRLSEDNEDSEG